MTGWVNRRSTRTTTVFACLLLTTSPCNTRFGIYRLLKNLKQFIWPFRRALARAHAHLERLLRNRHVRIDADPPPARALHMASHGAPRRLDLACGHPVRLHRLEAELTKAQRRAAGGGAFDPALVRLAEFRAHRLQHGTSPLSDFQPTLMPQRSRCGRPCSLSAMRLSCAIGSCSRLSPLKIHTLTPQVP